MKQTEHSEIRDGITYTLEIEPDDTPLRGNVSATGDAQVDSEAEDWVRTQLYWDNQWAWCVVTVTATVEHNGETFEGHDTLSNCSYTGKGQFMERGGYYGDMCHEAARELWAELKQAVERGEAADSLMHTLADAQKI